MNNKWFFLAVIAMSIVASAWAQGDGADAAITGISAAQIKQDAENYKAFGGCLKRPNTQKGRIVYVNCQKKVRDFVLKANAALMERELHYAFEVQEGVFDVANVKLVGDASLFVIDDPKLPTLLAAPEDRWAAVNVSKLAPDGAVRDLEVRTGKELSRGLMLLGGGFQSSFEQTLTECITSPSQLDRYPDIRLPFDTLRSIEKYLKGYGLRPYEQVYYCDAVAEGWAPAPKDDVQRQVKKNVEASVQKKQ